MTSPVPGYRVTTAFGVPGSWAAGKHTGEDYACPVGTPVVAAAPGTVMRAEWQGDYGNRIDIRCEADSCEHSYSHLSRFHVKVGQVVGEGQMIGESGNTGRSTGPHLHYEERHHSYGYWDFHEPNHSHSAEEPEPQPDDDEEDDMPKPYAVNEGDGWCISDLATYRTPVADYNIIDNGLALGIYLVFNAGNPVSPVWVEYVRALPDARSAEASTNG